MLIPDQIYLPLYSFLWRMEKALPYRRASDTSASAALTLVSIKSRTTRNSSGGISFGSGMFQSALCLALTNGQASPQPIVATKSYSTSGTSDKDFDWC